MFLVFPICLFKLCFSDPSRAWSPKDMCCFLLGAETLIYSKPVKKNISCWVGFSQDFAQVFFFS